MINKNKRYLYSFLADKNTYFLKSSVERGDFTKNLWLSDSELITIISLTFTFI